MQLLGAAPVFEFYFQCLFKTVFFERSPAGAKRNWESPLGAVLVHDHGKGPFLLGMAGNSVVLLKDKLPIWLKTSYSLSITKEARTLSPNSDLPAIMGILNDRLNAHK